LSGWYLDSSTAVGPFAHSVEAHDLDGDGDNDLIAAVPGLDAVAVVENNGGVLSAPVTLATGPNTFPKFVTAADVTGDGVLDLVSANQESLTDDDVTVFTGAGDGTFSTGVSFAACERPHQVAVGDADGDGDGDIAVACWGGSDIALLRNDGTGGFGAPELTVAADAPHAIATDDLDGDGDLDLAVAAFGDSRSVVLLNNGDGTYAPAVEYWSGSNPHDLVLSDVDANGTVDLVVAAAGSDQVSVLLGQGDGSFATASFYPVGADPRGVAAGDLNDDGIIDFVSANTHGNYPNGSDPTSLSVYHGNGAGGFVLAETLDNDLTPFNVDIAQIVSGGRAEIVSANWHSGDLSLWVYF
jgi:hypothetical protein